MLTMDRIDHVVLTVTSIEATCSFYTQVLGMAVVEFGDGRKALSFGANKINLHERGREIEPRADRPTPGSADLCLITSGPIVDVVEHLRDLGVAILEGPVPRAGATGPIDSVYLRDPDLNLIEVATYDKSAARLESESRG